MRGAKDRTSAGSGGSSSSTKMRLDQIFSLFLLLAFLLFSLFYLQHMLSGPPQSDRIRPTWPSPVSSDKHRHRATAEMDDIERYEMEERRDLGLDEEADRMAAHADHTSADEITFLFASLDKGDVARYMSDPTWKKDQPADQQKEHFLERDVKNMMEIIKAQFSNERVRVLVEEKHQSIVQPYITDKIDVKHVDVAALREWEHYSTIEKIRTADWWATSAPEVANTVQGTSDLYAPVMMHHLLWLRDLALDNPFHTKYFMWLDNDHADSPCIPRLGSDRGITVDKFKTKGRYFMDKFLTTITPMYRDHHIHGCNRAALLRLSQDKTVCFETKAWVMGGKKEYIMRIAELYEDMIAEALPLGCLGTEETILSLVWYNRPDLFHVHFNAPKHVPFDGGDFCRMVNMGHDTDWKDPDMYTQQKWFQEQKKLKAAKNAKS